MNSSPAQKVTGVVILELLIDEHLEQHTKFSSN